MSTGRMNRRGFLSLLGGTAAAMTLDPERLLWRPGAKLISIPKPAVKAISVFSVGDRVTFCGDSGIFLVTAVSASGISFKQAVRS